MSLGAAGADVFQPIPGRSPVGLRAWHHCFDRCHHRESVLLLEQRHPVAMSSGGLRQTSAGGPGVLRETERVQVESAAVIGNDTWDPGSISRSDPRSHHLPSGNPT